MKEVGEFLQRAREAITVLQGPLEDGPPTNFDVVLTRLSRPQDLEGTFAKAEPGTPYAFFSTVQDPEAKVVILVSDVANQTEQALCEAALGMMDNPVFR